ncbi:unnamed protein product [Brassicogethes aeneus]|uniref:VWFC domain-containing protein n=1 Tax=Brassicogethes aeneus TaxID=1431903 RepID=A0A9P0B5A1_BRAAE|nr:unnamed protein product [Brassicogethes aeneus]
MFQWALGSATFNNAHTQTHLTEVQAKHRLVRSVFGGGNSATVVDRRTSATMACVTVRGDERRPRTATTSSSSAIKCSRCWCFAVTLCCASLFWILDSVAADCWYEEERHEEGIEVATIEPCLNCTCSKGVLLCYLRVCPKLPNPPPPGCILLHRYRTCCSELICPEMPSGGNTLEARSEPDDNGIEIYDRKILRNACVVNGSIYGPGSAMDSSTLCEYCYCLAGKQTCVKPKCLLPIEGCTPINDPTSCCPVRYNCTRRLELSSTTSSTTTTMKPYPVANKGGCLVDNMHYLEGGKVLGMGHSICDNCYCIRGILRCEPLSCAPALLGCSPIIKPGECCAASYNCSGTIEIQAEPHYGQFPTVSKEYAKLRKEVQQRKPLVASKKTAVTENTNMPYYVIAESSETFKTRLPGSFGTTRHFTGLTFNPSTVKPFYYSKVVSMDNNNNKHSTRSYTEKRPDVYYATTNYEFQNKNFKRPFSTTNKPLKDTTKTYKEEKLRSSDYLGLSDESLLSIVDSLLDVRLNRKVENETTETTETSTTTIDDDNTTIKDESTTTLDITTTTDNFTDESDNSTTEYFTTDSNEVKNNIVTVKTVTNSTDCTDNLNNTNTILHNVRSKPEFTTVLPVDANEINKLAELKTLSYYTTTDDFSSEVTTNGDVTEVDLESRVKVSSVTMKSLGKSQPDIEAILNITKHKDSDYDYDYNEPSLPPSLPNLKIIPFVAADALDSKNQIAKDNNIYPQDRISSDISFGYSNLFSPPSETEGGFVPKEAPILDNFYENAVTMPSITNPPKSTELDCLTDSGKISHGMPTNSDLPCTTCTCFYGNIVCQKPECPPAPRLSCRVSTVQDLSLCCPSYVCDDEEAPTVVLDRLENISNSQEVVTVAEGVSTHDPFRDVIRTEPAPDLQSLIVDMMPFLARKTTPIPTTTTTTASPTTVKINNETNVEEDEFSLDKVLQLLFSGDKEDTTTIKPSTILPPTVKTKPPAPSTTQKPKPLEKTTENSKRQKAKNKTKPNNLNSVVNSPPPGVGLLKLAGCNIYGRMYRVGRIISELSGPCLECKCTDIGVQCKALKC